MYKKLVYIIFFALPFISLAQDNRFGIRLGIGGINSSEKIGPWMDPGFLMMTGNTKAFEQNGGISIRAGILAEIYLNDVLSFQPELLFTTAEVENKRPNNNVIVQLGQQVMLEEERATYALRYIEVPMSLKYNFYRKWSILAGMSPAFNVYSKIHMNYWQTDPGNTVDDVQWGGNTYSSASEEVEKFAFDHATKIVINANAELNFNIGRRGFLFLSYSASLNNIYNLDDINGYNMKTKFQTISFGIGGLF